MESPKNPVTVQNSQPRECPIITYATGDRGMSTNWIFQVLGSCMGAEVGYGARHLTASVAASSSS
jgi:hypothetical protein